MPENLTPQQDKFRSFCVDQVQRLSQFKQFEFMSSAAQRDYRKWLERKCAACERVELLMNAAVELENMPTIANLNGIFADLFGTPFAEPEISIEERKARALYLRDWYAQEAEEAERRRQLPARIAGSAVKSDIVAALVTEANRITEADFARVRSEIKEQAAKQETGITAGVEAQ